MEPTMIDAPRAVPEASLWVLLLIVFVAGAIGGLVNALLSDNGFVLPKYETAPDLRIWRPGSLVNVFIGGVAASISWGLYGPFAGRSIIPQARADTDPVPNLSLAALVGAVLVGVAGSRWLTNEIDKILLRAAATKAGKGAADPDLAAKLAVAPPAQAFRMTAGR
jgi:hypothetical protein